MKKIVFLTLSIFSSALIAEGSKDIAGQASKGIDTWELNFGLGVEQYQERYVEKASIRGEDRTVILEQTYITRPSAWLTINWNIWGKGSWVEDLEGNLMRNTTFGFFAGTKLIGSDTSAFSAFSLGPQVSFELENKKVVSLGAGWVTHQTKTLANGIAEGKDLPLHFDDIVYEYGTENSFMIMLSIGI